MFEINFEKVAEIVENAPFGFCGIRIDDGVYSIGESVLASRVWVDGEPTDEYLDGSCCIGIAHADVETVKEACELALGYYGGTAYIIGGDSMEYGEDEGEYIIKDAVVVAML